MNNKTLQAISGELLQRKIVAESNIEVILMNDGLKTQDKVDQVIEELEKVKNYSLMLNFWEQFVSDNIVTSKNEEV